MEAEYYSNAHFKQITAFKMVEVEMGGVEMGGGDGGVGIGSRE